MGTRQLSLFIAALAMSVLTASTAIAGQCGGIRGLHCGSGEWCDFTDKCGFADRVGSCRARPQACTRESVPVCGCNGQTYPNACEAHAAGFDVNYPGACRG